MIATFPLAPRYPYWPEILVLSPDGKRLYVVSRYDRAVTVLDTTSGDVLGAVQLAAKP